MEESKDHTTKVKALYADIFGGDSDDDDDDDAKIDNTVSNRLTETTKVITSSNNTRRDDDDDLFADSDDDNNATGGRVGDHEDEDDIFKPSSSSKTIVINEDNLFDSDDEGEENTTSIFQSSIRMKRPKGRMSQSKGKDKNKDKKIAKKRKLNKSSKPNDDSDNDDSGDAYDSGEEVKETAEDRNFIDEDDDFADVVKEYDEDNTDFRDDYDEDNDYNSSKKGKKGGRKGVDSDIRRSLTVNATRDTDPLSLTLLAMKNPKAKVMSESDKERFVEKLQRKMAEAVELDDELFRQQQPAIHKMQLLESVQIALSMKPMHQTFLEKDILGTLRDWIEPRDASTLPALSVRTAIYEILLQLPCQPDQLKRTSGNRPPIGAIIVMLRKHKMETAENKRILKDIMDKWSRPIFSKSTDIRISGNGGVLLSTDHQEVQEAINQRYTDDTSGGMDYNHHHQNTSKGGINNSSNSSRGAHIPVGFDAIMSQQTNTEPTQRINAQFSRARTPYNKGFLFTVQPELKNIDKRNIMEKALGEERMKLYKKITSASRGKNTGLGKKLNPR